MNATVMRGAKQCGKTARMKELVAEPEATGEWVVIASATRGLRCSRCDRDADVCKGSCIAG